MLGGAIAGGVAGASASRNHYHFTLSLSKGDSRTLTKEYLIARFKDRGKTELWEKFNAEPDRDRDFILLRYAEMLNAIFADDGTGVPTYK